MVEQLATELPAGVPAWVHLPFTGAVVAVILWLLKYFRGVLREERLAHREDRGEFLQAIQAQRNDFAGIQDRLRTAIEQFGLSVTASQAELREAIIQQTVVMHVVLALAGGDGMKEEDIYRIVDRVAERWKR